MTTTSSSDSCSFDSPYACEPYRRSTRTDTPCLYVYACTARALDAFADTAASHCTLSEVLGQPDGHAPPSISVHSTDCAVGVFPSRSSPCLRLLAVPSQQRLQSTLHCTASCPDCRLPSCRALPGSSGAERGEPNTRPTHAPLSAQSLDSDRQ